MKQLLPNLKIMNQNRKARISCSLSTSMVCIIGALFCLHVQNSSAQGNALDFDGTNDYVTTGAGLVNFANDMTVEAWFNTSNTTGYNSIATIERTAAGTNNFLQILTNSSGNIYLDDANDAPIIITTETYNDGRWHHVAFVRNATAKTIFLYVDGVLKGSETYTYSGAIDPDHELRFGNSEYQGGSYQMDGMIDEIRIWNDVRTEEEIKANMDNSLVGNEAGLLAYYIFDETSGTNLPDITGNGNNGTLNNMTDDDWVESYAMVYPISADITIYDSESFTLSWDAPETGIVEGYLIDVDDNADFSSPLVSYDGYNSGTDTFEIISGIEPMTTYYARVCAYKSSVGEVGAWSETKSVKTDAIPPGNALDFDGTDDYIMTSLNSSASNIVTIEGWFSFNTLGSQQNIIYITQGGGSDCRIVPYKDASDQINLFVSNGINDDVLLSGYEVDANTWYHIAFVYDNQFASIYINGELKASETLGYAYSLDGTDLLYIASDVGASFFTDAKIDEIRIWNTARTATEIKENLNNPLIGNETGLVVYYNFNMLSGTSLPDQSTNSNDGILYNMTDEDWVESYAMVYPITADITTYDSESFTFSWDAPENGIVEAYLIDVDDNMDFSSPLASYDGYNSGTDTFEIITGLNPVTTYYARVRGFKSSAGEVGAWSEVKSVTTAKADQTITFGEIPTKTYGNADFVPGATASSGLTVSYSSSDEDVATIVSGEIHIVSAGTCTIYANQAGNATYNAAAVVEQNLTINPKELTITGASASNKTYDGNTDAVISGATLSGVIASDVVTLDGSSTGTFASEDVGTGIGVTTAMSISGTDAGNYTLTQPTGLIADITVATLTITGASASNKTYDGNTDAVISGATLSGVVAGDVVTLDGSSTGTFASEDAGTGIGVTTAMSISGTDAGNYTLTQPTGFTADITTAELTVTGAVAENKEYDGNTDAVISGATLSGIVSGDDVTLENATTGTFATAEKGTGISVLTAMTISGADAANYFLTQPTGLTADITGIILTVTDAVIASKVYDGTTDAVISGATLNGVLNSDDVTLENATTGSFASKDVGTGIAVTTAMTITGTDAASYTLTQPTGLTADITAVALEITADARTKEEGQTEPALTYSITNGSLIAGESLTGELSREAGETAGTYAILQGTLSAGTNYSITFISADFVITPTTSINTESMISLNVHPNPATEIVYIELEDLNAQMLTITNITGNQVYIQTNIDPVITIDLSGLNNGVYILCIKTDKQIFTTRIIKD